MHSRVTEVYVCVGLSVCYHPRGNSFRLLQFCLKVSFKRYSVICLPWLGLTFSVKRRHSKIMFLTNSPASALSNDIGKTGSISQKNPNCLLFDSLALQSLAWAAVNVRVLTGCAHDNNPPCGANSIIGVVQLQ